jgi:hypothetical protein
VARAGRAWWGGAPSAPSGDAHRPRERAPLRRLAARAREVVVAAAPRW